MSVADLDHEVVGSKNRKSEQLGDVSSIGVVGVADDLDGVVSRLSDAGFNVIVSAIEKNSNKFKYKKSKFDQNLGGDFYCCDMIVSLISSDSDVRASMLGKGGIVHKMKPGSLHLSLGVISPALSRRLAAEHERMGQHYAAAQLLGGGDGASIDDVTALVSGPAEAVAKARMALRSMAGTICEIGEEASSANLLGLVASALIAMTIENMSEVLALTRKCGIDETITKNLLTRLFKEKINSTCLGKIVSKEFGESSDSVSSCINSIRLLHNEAERWNVSLPSVSASQDRLVDATARGWGNLELSVISLLSYIDANSGERIDRKYIF